MYVNRPDTTNEARRARAIVAGVAEGCRGLGKLLVGCAVDRCLKAREQIAAYTLIVDAKDETARRFYEHFGFKRLMDRSLTLYLPLGR